VPEMSTRIVAPRGGVRNFIRGITGSARRAAKADAERGAEILREQFEREGTIDGRWAPLSPRTIAQKGFSRILFRTGELADSVFVRQSGRNSYDFGIRHSKFDPRLHEFGSPGRNIPARPSLGPATRQLQAEKGGK